MKARTALRVASLICWTSKQRLSPPSNNPSSRRQVTSKWLGHRAVPRRLQEGRQQGVVGVRENPRATTAEAQ